MAKQKATLQEKLKKRKFHKTNPVIYGLYYFIMTKLVMVKYRPKVEVVDRPIDCKGPCFIVWNHLSRLDHAYILKAAFPRRVSIVAGYNEFFRSHLHTVFFLEQVLPKKNFAQDIPGLKAIQSIINQGGCVALSPEGCSSVFGHNQPVVAGTGHYLKHFGIPVYFMEFHGQYLTSTKCCLDERYGLTTAHLSLLYTPEQLAALSDEEVDDQLNELFRTDDYAWTKARHIKWKTNGEICKRLEDICYRCPRCGRLFTMMGEKNRIECSACGNGATMDDYYEFHPYRDAVIPEAPTNWADWERKEVIREIRTNPDFSFQTHVNIGDIPTDHWIPKKQAAEPCGDGILTIDHKGIHFDGVRRGASWHFDQNYGQHFTAPVEVATDRFHLYVDGEYIEFFPELHCVGYIIHVVEEMHRFHVNYWKNFHWFDYMYEGLPEKAEE